MPAKTKVLVIGSNSFSGSSFIDLLLEIGKYSVVGISRSPEKSRIFLPYKRHAGVDFKFHQMDVNLDMAKIIGLIDSFRPDYIVNFAAQSEVAPSWDNPAQWFRTNTSSVTELADAIKSKKFLKRYVHISSPEIYGSCHGVVKEDAVLNPSTPYAASKAAGDLSLFTFFKNYGFPLVVIRSTNVYGAHQQLFKIIPRSILYIKLNRPIGLHGGGLAVKSYVHIKDISKGELVAMEHGIPGAIYHLSPDSGISVKDTVSLICRKMGIDFDTAVTTAPERLGQDAAYVIDSSKARKELGWRPIIDIDQGLSETIRWVETEWNSIKKERLEYVHKA